MTKSCSFWPKRDKIKRYKLLSQTDPDQLNNNSQWSDAESESELSDSNEIKVIPANMAQYGSYFTEVSHYISQPFSRRRFLLSTTTHCCSCGRKNWFLRLYVRHK